ncbi:MAG TPA: NF038143 family protein [Desulfobacteraceae bacterium]|nr:NF038143 family protein [Desulfobacteraceae bacterium]
MMEKSDSIKSIILAHERQFAAKLASSVMEKPKLSSWMIFIPFIFIFYFQDFSKYKKKRKEFIENHLLSRRKALDEAREALLDDRKPDTSAIANQAGLKPKAADQYGQFMAILADHYTGLLKGAGDNYTGVIKSVYGDRPGDYLFFINRLNNAEKALNAALAPRLKKAQDGVAATIKKIEKNADNLRRAEVKAIYS